MITRRAHSRRTGASKPMPVSCPSCGWQADSDLDKARLRDELLTEWWSVDPLRSGAVTTSRYCYRCQPHEVYLVECRVCRDGQLLAGELAVLALSSTNGLPQLIVDELTRNSWRQASNAPEWVCCR